jgi:hypothetical protein
VVQCIGASCVEQREIEPYVHELASGDAPMKHFILTVGNLLPSAKVIRCRDEVRYQTLLRLLDEEMKQVKTA